MGKGKLTVWAALMAAPATSFALEGEPGGQALHANEAMEAESKS